MPVALAAAAPAAPAPGRDMLRSALVVYAVLLAPRTAIPLYRWTGADIADIAAVEWLLVTLDSGQLLLLTAWWTRRAAEWLRVGAALWAAGVAMLATWVPTLGTYALLYFAQAAIVGLIFVDEARGGVRTLAARADGVRLRTAMRGWGRDAAVALTAFAAMWASGTVCGWIWEAWPPPGAEQGPLGIQDIQPGAEFAVRGQVTAVLEECAAALLAAGMARRGVPLRWILLAGCALRVAYHTYMGWSAVAVALTAVAMILLYRWYGRVLPLIVAHAALNLSLFVAEAAGETLALAGAVVGYTMIVVRVARRGHPDDHAVASPRTWP